MSTYHWSFFFLLIVTTTYSHSKPTLLTFVVRFEPGYNGPQDVVAVDPETGSVTKLDYHLPTGDKLCAKVDQQRGLVYVLHKTDYLTMYSLKDGHEVGSYNITTEVGSYFESWNYDFDRKLLYGVCLKPDQTTTNWNFTWCYAHFDENGGSGKLQYGGFVSIGGQEGLGSGYCSDIPMNKDTFTTGQYWYTDFHCIIVKNVKSSNGTPWYTLLSVEDRVNFEESKFAALVAGSIDDKALVIRYDYGYNSFIVSELLATWEGGQEIILAKLPSTLNTQGLTVLPWAYDAKSRMLYIMMQTTNPTKYMLPDTLVKVDLTQPQERAVETMKLPLKSLNYDGVNYTVFETHFIDI